MDLDRSRADGDTAAGAPGDEGSDLRRGGALLAPRSVCRGTSGELHSGTIGARCAHPANMERVSCDVKGRARDLQHPPSFGMVFGEPPACERETWHV